LEEPTAADSKEDIAPATVPANKIVSSSPKASVVVKSADASPSPATPEATPISEESPGKKGDLEKEHEVVNSTNDDQDVDSKSTPKKEEEDRSQYQEYDGEDNDDEVDDDDDGDGDVDNEEADSSYSPSPVPMNEDQNGNKNSSKERWTKSGTDDNDVVMADDTNGDADADGDGDGDGDVDGDEEEENGESYDGIYYQKGFTSEDDRGEQYEQEDGDEDEEGGGEGDVDDDEAAGDVDDGEDDGSMLEDDYGDESDSAARPNDAQYPESMDEERDFEEEKPDGTSVKSIADDNEMEDVSAPVVRSTRPTILDNQPHSKSAAGSAVTSPKETVAGGLAVHVRRQSSYMQTHPKHSVEAGSTVTLASTSEDVEDGTEAKEAESVAADSTAAAPETELPAEVVTRPSPSSSKPSITGSVPSTRPSAMAGATSSTSPSTHASASASAVSSSAGAPASSVGHTSGSSGSSGAVVGRSRASRRIAEAEGTMKPEITIQAAYAKGSSTRPYNAYKMAAPIPALLTDPEERQAFFKSFDVAQPLMPVPPLTPTPTATATTATTSSTESTSISTVDVKSPPLASISGAPSSSLTSLLFLSSSSLSSSVKLIPISAITSFSTDSTNNPNVSLGPLDPSVFEYTTRLPLPPWPPAELEALNRGLETVGKNFTRISREYVPTRSTHECIEAYYSKKHSLRYHRVKVYKKEMGKEEEEYVKYVSGVNKYVTAETRRIRNEVGAGGANSLLLGFDGGMGGGGGKDGVGVRTRGSAAAAEQGNMNSDQFVRGARLRNRERVNMAED
jgi:hypothetical protein